MGKKSVVISIKCADLVYSWEGDRNLAGLLIDPAFFADPSASPLCSSESKLVLPVLGHLYRTQLTPGSSGWIGIDVDRRVIFDAQSYRGEFGAFSATLGRDRVDDGLTEVPESVIAACRLGPWKTRAELHNEPTWLTHAPLRTDSDWNEALSRATEHALKQTTRSSGRSVKDLGRAWMQIQPPLHPGWRLAPGYHPCDDVGDDFRRFSRLLSQLKSGGWGWSPDVWPHWREQAIELRGLLQADVDSIEAKYLSRHLSSSLPKPNTRPPARSPRF